MIGIRVEIHKLLFDVTTTSFHPWHPLFSLIGIIKGRGEGNFFRWRERASIRPSKIRSHSKLLISVADRYCIRWTELCYRISSSPAGDSSRTTNFKGTSIWERLKVKKGLRMSGEKNVKSELGGMFLGGFIMFKILLDDIFFFFLEICTFWFNL